MFGIIEPLDDQSALFSLALGLSACGAMLCVCCCIYNRDRFNPMLAPLGVAVFNIASGVIGGDVERAGGLMQQVQQLNV